MAKKKSVYQVMMFFKDIEKTEGAFYLRFQEMSNSDLNLLMAFYHVSDKERLFGYIKKFWNIRR